RRVSVEVGRSANARLLFASLILGAFLAGLPIAAAMAHAPAGSQSIERIGPGADTEQKGVDKVTAEIAKIQAETSALKAIGDQTRWWTTILTAVGSIVGAIVGGVFTFVVTKMGQRFNSLQKELEDSRSERDRLRREDDEN